MADPDIHEQILLTLARLYEDPVHRSQFKQFKFASSDREAGERVLHRLERNLIVEAIRPGIVRFTDSGYNAVQGDLVRLRMKTAEILEEMIAKETSMWPPDPGEIEQISRVLGSPDFVMALRCVGRRYVVCWATDGFQRITGYTVNELNAAGGVRAVLHDSASKKGVQAIASRLLAEGRAVKGDLSILSKSGRVRRIQIVAAPRAGAGGRTAAWISAVREVTPIG